RSGELAPESEEASGPESAPGPEAAAWLSPAPGPPEPEPEPERDVTEPSWLVSSPRRHSTTIMPGPRLAASASVGRRRDTTVRSRRGNTSSGRTDRPKMPYQRSSSPRYRATPRRQEPFSLRRPHSTVPPPRSSRNRRAAIPAAASTRTTRKAARSHAASSASPSPTDG